MCWRIRANLSFVIFSFEFPSPIQPTSIMVSGFLI